MGSVRALVVLASLSACEMSGLEVVVLPPAEGATSTDEIRLFIGKGEETEGAIGPESFAFGEQRYGNIWVRDPMNDADTLPYSGSGSVSFGFVADSDRTELGAVIAVGYSAGVPTSAGSLFHLETGVGNVRLFDLQLHAAFDPREKLNRDKELQVEVWGEQPCLHLANSREDRVKEHKHDNIFIVAPGDRDCDGYADDDGSLECTADVYQGTTPAEADDLACALPMSWSEIGTGCELGGLRCVDGPPQPSDAVCAPSRFCAPTSVCTRCQGLSGQPEQDCIRDPFAHALSDTEMFGIECHLSTEQDTSDPSSPTKLCDTPVIVTSVLPAETPMPNCSNAEITTVGQPASRRLEIGAMRFGVDVAYDTCAFAVTARGDLPVNFAYTATLGGLVTVDLSSGRSIALPIKFFIQPPSGMCVPNASRCYIIGEDVDSPGTCLKAPMQPMAP